MHVFVVGPCPCGGQRLSHSIPSFGSFTLLEPVSLVKAFRLFRLEQIFFVVQSVNMAG